MCDNDDEKITRQVKIAKERARSRWSISKSEKRVYMVIFNPPLNSVYGRGLFFVQFRFPGGYPIYPPAISWHTRIFHPNVYSNGEMVIPFIKEEWSFLSTFYKLLEHIYSLFDEPDIRNHAICNSVAYLLYKNNRNVFVERAKQETLFYAT